MSQPSDAGSAISIHASAVVVGEAGIIIRGIAGAGKSSLALGLITASQRAARFARLIGDDRIELRRCHGRLIARGHPRVRGMVERRGHGIVRIEYEPAAVARLIVDIVQEATRYPGESEDRLALCGVELPRFALRRDAAAYDSALAILAKLERD